MEEVPVETLKRSYQSVEDIIKCSICLVKIRPTAVQCVNAHLICAECKRDLIKCPTCQEAFSEEPLGRVLTQLLEALPQQCRHTNCGKYLGDADDHEQYCGFRETICKIIECQWKGPMNDLLNHVKTEHKTLNIFNERTYLYSWPEFYPNEDRHTVSPIFAFGHFLWGEMHNNPELNQLSVTYHWLPIGKPDHELYVERKFYSLQHKTRLYSCKIQISSDPDDPADVNKMFIPLGVLPKFVDKDQNLRYKNVLTKE